MEYDMIMEMYNQPWRHYHTWGHVERMLELQKSRYPFLDRELVECFCVFHDCVYDPCRNDNEVLSNEKWKEYAKERYGADFINRVGNAILLTQHPEQCQTEEEIALRNLDWNDMGVRNVIDDDYAEWLQEYEEGIFREYQFVPVEEYVRERTNFIWNSVARKLITRAVAQYLLPLVSRKRRVGIYAGSFNPFHVGHLNILKKAEQMFDKVIVARGSNPAKDGNADFDNVKTVLGHHEVEKYDCQLVDYVNSKRSELVEPVLVRGLRNGYDLNQEVNLISFVNEQADARGIGRIPIAYIHCDKEYEHVSSSAVRMLQEQDAKRYIPGRQ